MKQDIAGRSDIEKLVNSFYDKVKRDDALGPIFNDIAKVDWPHHLPIMYNFWEMVLFGKGTYKGDPMTKHIQLNRQTTLTPAHFDRWKGLFFETIDEHFSGNKAEEAKLRATNIASLMLYRVQKSVQLQ
ncbi:MAG TPA: group III truncated hemoglobin [Cyclobacteriaceae bacterium]|nr:group III truncated hemoglobin [Cyclobacteriaceae bacterium]MCB9238503.1 group III truncated hemoglobin [Flammeovirgaceae bacterium]MCB0500474.1 group III truncated hemoglobin [Cyclobacteriaceae bacterium]MCO5271451.1 group III truncated hemoglobin [Cyclobacteriaceae bacterium]MCW5903629.1 group III truncated hemoglobin [Cyclobacteriaceae bacterium]